MTEDHLFDILDPQPGVQPPAADHALADDCPPNDQGHLDWLNSDDGPNTLDRPTWKPIYMGEGHPMRCDNCSRIKRQHERGEDLDFNLYCFESFLRIQDGNR